ncbi:hypothetical protein SARC_07005 [Sphaeroforma arctica JP610]|uniref:Helicase ATP-binding domain-containing protein n=1 Tax=Sphaeroforma arctica JP610 TaxID=667725 RepID=A0A0L0FVR9_9EUKA|nr:hypothetical protein SARC_07005 [Sphaeroforma arctica JP610]KNC80641.1 hypothetical protein SARC_07005 [Sphaeroforma arctica JP610]|eukprot:XP_014154543.1 hypothetical protein SARC_07005 [Sphaeroforma arctica JP610]
MRRLGLRQPTKAQGIHSEGKRPVDLQSLDVQNSELSKGQNEQHTTKDSASMATENTVKHRTAHRATVDLRIAGLLDGLDDDSFFGDDMIIANEPSTGVDKNTTIEANTGIIAYTAIRLNPTHSINTEKDMGAKLDRRKVGGINSAEYQQSENSNVDVMTTEDEKNAQYMDTHVGTDDAGDRAANIDRELMNMCAPVSIGTNNNLSGENGYCATDSRNSHSAVHPGMKRNVEYGFGVANNLINHSTHDAAPGHGGNDSHSAVFTHTVNTHSVLSGGKGVLTGRATDASAVCQQNEANKLTATVASSFGRQETAPIPHELQEARKGPKVNEEMQRVPSVSPNGQRGTDSLHEVYIGGQRSVACILRRPSDDLVDPQIEEHSQVSQAQYGMTEDLSPERQRLSVEKGQTPVASGDRLNISYWVSKKAASAYQAYANVVQMFEWQAECMAYAVEGLKKGRGIVYSAPTSGGKTLVAELLLIRRILTTKKKCLFIVPYNSIVVEKSAHFVKLFKTLNLVVYNYGGPQNTFTFERADLIVCTAEKANGICNKLIAEHKMHTLGMVVVDELHMVADDKRGSILEMLMIKIMAAKAGMGHSIPTTQISTQASTQMQTQTQIHTQMQSQSSYMMNMTQAGLAQTQEQFLKGTQNCTPNNGDTRCSIQVVAMSATLSNLKVLAEWLDAEMYVTSFRPVELVQYFKFGRGIYDTEGKFVRDFLQTAPDDPKPDFLVEKQDSTKYEYKHAAVDQSGLAPLCWETVKSGHSVLIFCQTRKFCQNSARLVNNCMPSALQTDEREALVDLVSRYKQIPTGWDKELVPLMLNGIAYHHSGLTLDERELVEEGFRRNIIKVLTATTTLSSGVNLPARRVIFRTIMQSRWNVTKVMYNQMKGRAGRTGKDDMGESIIICKDRNEKQMAIELMGTAIPPVKSALGNLSVKSLTNPSASSSDRSGPKSEATDSKSPVNSWTSSRAWMNILN